MYTARHQSYASWKRYGFSLTELLVVIGIIGLLAALLFPALSASRKAARMSVCLNNLQQLSRAVQNYLNENHDCMPEASSTNSADSPYSPAGLMSIDVHTYDSWDPIPKIMPPNTDDSRLGPGRFCMPPIGQLLDQYLKNTEVWKCPDQPQRGPGGFRTGNYVYEGTPQTVYTHLGEWRPGYMYLSTKEYHWFEGAEQKTYSTYWMNAWGGRNVAGMRLSEIKPGNHEDATSVAIFMDYLSTFHSTFANDLYSLDQKDLKNPIREKFQSNILYLDGHCDTVHYSWQGELLNKVHKSILQTWWGETFDQGNVPDYVN